MRWAPSRRLAAPAYAEEYYIVHGNDLHCRANHIPEDHTIVQVGPIGFKTRVAAERELGVVCRANGYYRDEELREAGGTQMGGFKRTMNPS